MPITLSCAGCGFSSTVDEAHAGKRAKCKRCGTVNVIPSPQPELARLLASVASPAHEPDPEPEPAFVAVALEDFHDEHDDTDREVDLSEAAETRPDPAIPAAIQAIARPSSPIPELWSEPWYYKVVHYTAVGILMLAGLVVVLVMLGSIVTITKFGPELLPMILMVGLIASGYAVVSALLIAIPMLLVVDVARTLRYTARVTRLGLER